MITSEKVKQELNIRVRESVRLKKNMDAAKTRTKKNYILKKLTKNNETVAKLLDYHSRHSITGPKDEVIPERNAEEKG